MQITTEELIIKYPKIFQDYEGNPGHANWHGVPSGWLPVIDDLCGVIQEYVDNHIGSTPNPNFIEDSKYDSEDTNTHRFIKIRPTQVMCFQMKEKFGGLRFYTNGHDEMVAGLIRYATYLCDNTCDRCGSRTDLGATRGWISVCCKSCAEKENRIEAGWIPRT